MNLHPHSYRNLLDNFSPSQKAEINLDHQWIKQLRQYVTDCLPDNIPDVEQLARQVHVSPRQLTRKLKAETGLTPGRFIKEIKLKVALRLIMERKYHSVSEVAFRCGFDYLSTFSTVFKERFGVSPRELQASRGGRLNPNLGSGK